jgi:hypothetical protein
MARQKPDPKDNPEFMRVVKQLLATPPTPQVPHAKRKKQMKRDRKVGLKSS